MENKTGKYFKYAIGEIILVVIGILIALQINNWNEKKKIAKEEKTLLIDLLKDVEQDIKNLEDIIKNDSVFLMANKNVLMALKDDSIIENRSVFIKTLINSAVPQFYNPTNTTFNTIKSSGKLGFFSSDTIRKKIQSYYDIVDRVKMSDQVNHNVIQKVGDPTPVDIDLNSMTKYILSESFFYELDSLDLSFYYKPINSEEIKNYANVTSKRQIAMFYIHRGHKYLLIEAKHFKKDLEIYSKSKQ
jgi:hypothetical protein